MQKYFKQFQSLTMITYLELGITNGVSVSLVSPLALAVGCQAVRLSQVVRHFILYCNHQVHRDFLITLYVPLMFTSV
jgi:hypothetical protein